MFALTREVYDDLIAYAREGAPEEVCGVLGGRSESDHREDSATANGEARAVSALADRYRRAENVAADPTRAYELDPEEQLAHMQAIEDAGRDVVGFAHSHPNGPPKPSATDERQATWPGYHYLIVSLDGTEPYVGCWRWTGEEFAAEPLGIRSR
ncbi:desampylase [Halorientalis halophila]|uniref:desampylase n=1 Tax=Halorientalis halophila TaxID=3108499 RepID=UPI0030084641